MFGSREVPRKEKENAKYDDFLIFGLIWKV